MTLNKPASSIQRAWNNYRSLEPDSPPPVLVSGSWWIGELSYAEFRARLQEELPLMTHAALTRTIKPITLGAILP